MLTDRHRLAKMLFLLAMLAGLGALYGSRASSTTVGFERCMEDPVRHHGSSVTLFLWTVTALEPWGVEVAKLGNRVPVEMDPAGLVRGQEVSITGDFDGARALVVARRLETHSLRGAKKALGALAFLALGVIVSRSFAVKGGRVVLRA